MAKLAIIVLAALLVATGVESNMKELKNKLLHRFGGGRNFNAGAYGAYGGGYGANSGSAAAAASAASSGYGSSSASAAASSSNGGSAASAAAVAGGSRRGWGGQGAGYGAGSAGGYGNGVGSAAAASVQNNYYAPPPAPAPAPTVRAPAPPTPAEPQRPNFDLNRFKSNIGVGAGFQPYNYGQGASSSATSSGGSVATSAALAAGGYQTGGYYAPGSYAAASGAYANVNDNGIEQRHSTNEVTNMENNEAGRADDDHYYHSQSYGKASDDNDHINYNKNFEDLMATPNVYHSVKSSESLLRDHNKNSRESGSAVEAKDHHSSAFQKHNKHFHQKADSGNVGVGNGLYGSENDNLNHNIDEDEEMFYDSDGLNNQQPPANYGGYANAASAVGGGYGGVATAAGLAGGYGNAAASSAVSK